MLQLQETKASLEQNSTQEIHTHTHTYTLLGTPHTRTAVDFVALICRDTFTEVFVQTDKSQHDAERSSEVTVMFGKPIRNDMSA